MSKHTSVSGAVENVILSLMCVCVCACVRACVRMCNAVLTHSQEGLVVVDVFGGERGAHAQGEGGQGQPREEPSQLELERHLLLP